MLYRVTAAIVGLEGWEPEGGRQGLGLSDFGIGLVWGSAKLGGLRRPEAVAPQRRARSPGLGPSVTPFVGVSLGEPIGDPLNALSWGRYEIMVCTIPASAWTWLVRPRKASAVTMSGAGFDAGEGNPGLVIILQKRLRVGTATVASSVDRGWLGSVWCSVPESPNGRSDDMGPPSSAKNVRGESGACLVDTFRLCDYGASTASSGPCALARPWSSQYRVGARPDEWRFRARLGKSTTGVVELESGGNAPARVGH
ncbi:hypothetical protein B296_00005207 [Ensete ventricosum]|uniref:Uncharacterized protein n=1 Tax=Ensete ventricosum TaxID=4639 RepID=A0A427B970_ENSVE|nr:hypothetical protein B296_00005207 [Ensete ventricosum]